MISLSILKNHFIKIVFFSTMSMILFSYCTLKDKDKETIFGTYRSVRYSKYNFFDNYPSDIKKNSTGNELELLNDGGFKYSTCANIIEGFWSFQYDTLKLICNSVKFKNKTVDELNECQNPIYFLVNNNELYWIDFNDKKEKRITIMRKYRK